MVLVKTSANGFVFPRSENPKGAFLADFDIDGAKLKKDHTDWLDKNVVGPAKAKAHTAGGWHIELVGRASKSGSDQHNMWLSDQRVQAVASYLHMRMFGLRFLFFPSRLGESQPYDSGEFEHELDRSVEIRTKFVSVKPAKRTKPPLLIHKPGIWKPRPNRKVMDFRLQVLKAAVDVTAFVNLRCGPIKFGFRGDARVKMLIRIRELGSSDNALYEYTGDGPGSILGVSPSVKACKPGGQSSFLATYGKGDIHSFATDVDMDAEDFAGPAIFHTDLLGRTFAFGPETSNIGGQEKIKNLSFGHTHDDRQYAEATTFGEMSIVESVPSWAK